MTFLFTCFEKDIVETHPGLEFLREAADFHSRYVHTVSSLKITTLTSLAKHNF